MIKKFRMDEKHLEFLLGPKQSNLKEMEIKAQVVLFITNDSYLILLRLKLGLRKKGMKKYQKEIFQKAVN